MEITKHLPSRGWGAITTRMAIIVQHAGTSSLKNRRRRRVWSDDDLRRMIEMKVVEHKSEQEIATEFDTSWKSVRGAWSTRCVKMLSQTDILLLQARRKWTSAEVNHLAELYIRTTITPNDLALHFPSKTLNAVNVKISRSRFQVAREQYQAELRDKAYGASPASHQKVEPKMNNSEQRRAFSSCSDGFINHRSWTASNILGPVSRWKTRHTLCRYELRRAFSSKRRERWTALEDQELLELVQQGLDTATISMKMGRSYLAVQGRKEAIRAGSSTRRYHWNAEEDSILLELRQKGLAFPEVAKCIPGRGLSATKERYRALSDCRMTKTKIARIQWTDAEAHRMVKMRVEERMSLREISIKLRRPYDATKSFWGRRCAQLVSNEDLNVVEKERNSWTSKELDHLKSMYIQGKKPREMTSHFPSRTANAIYKTKTRYRLPWKDLPRGT
jgi:hypothetical protein